MTQVREVDAVVVGAGFAGLRALHTLREAGFSVAVLERGQGIGGVWFWNRYPGARCDVESYDYSYSFSPELEQDWRWSERYATQPEILRYVEHVADRFDLRRDVHLGVEVRSAEFDEGDDRWTVRTGGDTWRATYLVMAVGNLSTTKAPELPGQRSFAGRILHSAHWPQEGVDLAGQRVGIIGTGSSGMQMVPIVAREAAHLTVFQRTPNFSVPAANAAITDTRDAEVKATYAQRREAARSSPTGLGFEVNRKAAKDVSVEERRDTYERAWNGMGFGFVVAFYDLLLDQQSNDTAADFIRSKIAETVEDPETLRKLTPAGFPFGAKRPSVDSGYFATFNRDDVTLVDLRDDPIVEVSAGGVRTATSGEHPLDVLVFATGFDAMTGSLLRPDIVGRGGLHLRDHWAAGPRTYLGPFVAGFPNLFIVAGPGSPSLLSNVLLSLEQHVDFLAGLLRHMRDVGATVFEATPEAEQQWVEHVNERAGETLYPRARSYYMGDEVPGKPRVFMPYVGGVRAYRRVLDGVVADGFRGLALTSGSGLASAPA